ncbi:MAG: type I methionyl aminopeptidase [Elusimicrobiaceae bacterium]|nr:type I methionyl aminopeptidase [Elusimicrobiaceae bacterium]
MSHQSGKRAGIVPIKRQGLIELKTPGELLKMRKAGQVVAKTLAVLKDAIRPGITTGELDRIAGKTVYDLGAKPSFLGYCGYPAVLCASVNEEVVHGIPADGRVLKAGDIVSLDMGAFVEGFHGDSAITVPVGKISARTQKLIDVTRTSLERAIEIIRPGATLGDIGHAVQSYAEGCGMSVVRDFVGHGIGRRMHEEPPVPNYGRKGAGPALEAGMVIAVEPMINAGGYEVRVLENGWTVVTVDGSLSAHFEHTIAVTEHGCELMTLP